MKLYCKISILDLFTEGKYYDGSNVSVFEDNDFISIINNKNNLNRFRLNKSKKYIEDYIGEYELYFYKFFVDIKEERLKKLNNINSI